MLARLQHLAQTINVYVSSSVLFLYKHDTEVRELGPMITIEQCFTEIDLCIAWFRARLETHDMSEDDVAYQLRAMCKTRHILDAEILAQELTRRSVLQTSGVRYHDMDAERVARSVAKQIREYENSIKDRPTLEDVYRARIEEAQNHYANVQIIEYIGESKPFRLVYDLKNKGTGGFQSAELAASWFYEQGR